VSSLSSRNTSRAVQISLWEWKVTSHILRVTQLPMPRTEAIHYTNFFTIGRVSKERLFILGPLLLYRSSTSGDKDIDKTSNKMVTCCFWL